MKLKLFAITAVLALALATGCSSDNEPSGGSTNGNQTTGPTSGGTTGTGAPTGGGPTGNNAGGNVVTATDSLAFNPATLQVAGSTTGTKVIWRNPGSVAHTVTFRDNSFDRPLPAKGQVEFTFAAPGTTKYFCKLHPTMEGQIIVQ